MGLIKLLKKFKKRKLNGPWMMGKYIGNRYRINPYKQKIRKPNYKGGL